MQSKAGAAETRAVAIRNAACRSVRGKVRGIRNVAFDLYTLLLGGYQGF